jgi:hypothetical protein
LEQLCPSQEDQLWSLKPKGRETTISDPWTQSSTLVQLHDQNGPRCR